MSQKNKQNSHQSINEEGFPEKRQKTTNSQTSKTPKTSNLDTKQNRPRKKRTPNPKLNTRNKLELNKKPTKNQKHKYTKLHYERNNVKEIGQEVAMGKDITKKGFQNNMHDLYETLQKACLMSSFALSENEEDKFQFFESKNKHLFFKKYYQGSNFGINVVHVFSEKPKRLFVSISIKNYDCCTIFGENKDPYSEDPDCEPSLFYLSKTIPLNEYISYLSTDSEKRIPVVFCGHGLGGTIAQIITFNLFKELDSRKIKLVIGKDLVGIGFGSPLWLKTNKIPTLNYKLKLLNHLFINVHCRNDLLPMIFTLHFSLCQKFLSIDPTINHNDVLKNFDYLIKNYFKSNKLHFEVNSNYYLQKIYKKYCDKKFKLDFKYSPIGIFIHSKKNKKFKLIFQRQQMDLFLNQLKNKMKSKFDQIFSFHNIISYLKMFNLTSKTNLFENELNNNIENNSSNNNNDNQKKKKIQIKNHPKKQIYKKYPIIINNLKVLACNDWIQITLIGKNLDHSAMGTRNQKFKLDDPYYPLILYNAPISEYSELTTIHISSNKLIFSMSNFKNFNFQNFSFKIKTLFNSSQEINILKENIIHRKISTKILKNFQNFDFNFFQALITQSFYQIKEKYHAKFSYNDFIESHENNNNGQYKFQKNEKEELLNSSILLNHLEELTNTLENRSLGFKDILDDTIFRNYIRGTNIAVNYSLENIQPLLGNISKPLLLSLKNDLTNYNILDQFGIYLDQKRNNKLRIGKQIVDFSGYGDKFLKIKEKQTQINYLHILIFFLTEIKSNMTNINLINASEMENEIIRNLMGDKKKLKKFIIEKFSTYISYIDYRIICNQEEKTNSSNSDDDQKNLVVNDLDDDSGNKLKLKIREKKNNSISNEGNYEIDHNEKEIELEIQKEEEKKIDSDSDYSSEKDNNKIIINNSNKEDEGNGSDQNDIDINYDDDDEDEDEDYEKKKYKYQMINEKFTNILESKFQNYKNFDSTSQLIINKRISFIFMINEMRKLLSKRLIIGVIGVSNSGKTTFVNKAFNKKLNCGISIEDRTREVSLFGLGDSNNYFVMDFPGSDDVEKKVRNLNKYFNCNPCLYVYTCTAEHIQRSERKALKIISKYNVPTIICLNKVDYYPELLKEEISKYKKYLETNSNDIYWTSFKPNKDHIHTKLKKFENKAKKCKNYRSIDDIKKWICKELYLQVESNKFLLKELKRVVENEFKFNFEEIKKQIEIDLTIVNKNNISNDNNKTVTSSSIINSTTSNNDYGFSYMFRYSNYLNKAKDLFQLKSKKKLTISTPTFSSLPFSKKKKINFFKFRAVVISNLQLGAGVRLNGRFPQYGNKRLLTEFLNSITKEKTITHLILLGNIWDNWTAPIYVQPFEIQELIKHYTWFNEALSNVYKSGKKIIYIKGNHDLDLTKEDLAIAFPDLPIKFYPEKLYYGRGNEILFQHGSSYDLFNQEVRNNKKLPKEFNYPFGRFLTRILASSGRLLREYSMFIKEFINSQEKEKSKQNINLSKKLIQLFDKLGMEKLIEKMLIKASGNEQKWKEFKEETILTNIYKDSKCLEIPIKSKGFWLFKSKGLSDSYSDYFKSLQKLDDFYQLDRSSKILPNYIKGAAGDVDYFLNNESMQSTKVVILGHSHDASLKKKKFESRNIICANTGSWACFSEMKSWIIIEIDNRNKISIDLKKFSEEDLQITETLSLDVNFN
ncbi:udp-2 [Anaeramoeba flamelloides]|uniref:Udp-2 n=1 Tax=Anaeramoeba flamelloides TaxID=1746091 RepID=A0ABQ8Z6L9_9EUKA|nr:udp-2 [Anaeramoeba flamelloides]